jgi:diguanylate cyclase (GGDEF)-like protein/PAS domain S-box-containing protein
MLKILQEINELRLAAIMEEMIRCDKFNLATAIISLSYSENSQKPGALLLDCNSLFTELTGLVPHKEKDILISAFGRKSGEYISALSQVLQKNIQRKIIMKFTGTKKYLYSMVTPELPDKLYMVCFDYTSIQEQLNAFKIQQIGYENYINNFHGMAFQRLIKPEAKSVFTAGAYEEITGYSSDQASSFKSWKEIIHPDDRERIEKEAIALYNMDGYKKELEYRIIRKDGAVRWIHSYDCNLHSEDGTMQMAQGLIVDVTNQKEQELRLKRANKKIIEQNEKLEEINMTDFLTGLSNRRSAQQVLSYLISEYKRKGNTFSIIMLDLDHFKGINDKYGHDGGDVVLRGISRILKENLREIDTKSRWGGEEFLIILPHTNRAEVEKIAWKLLRKVRESIFEYNKKNIQLTFSAGVSTYNKTISLQSLLQEADKALYQAKEKGRNQIISL